MPSRPRPSLRTNVTLESPSFPSVCSRWSTDTRPRGGHARIPAFLHKGKRRRWAPSTVSTVPAVLRRPGDPAGDSGLQLATDLAARIRRAVHVDIEIAGLAR